MREANKTPQAEGRNPVCCTESEGCRAMWLMVWTSPLVMREMGTLRWFEHERDVCDLTYSLK